MDDLGDRLLGLLVERAGRRRRCRIDYAGLVWAMKARYPGRPRPKLWQVEQAVEGLCRAGAVRLAGDGWAGGTKCILKAYDDGERERQTRQD